MSASLATAVRDAAAQPAPTKPTPANQFVMDRMHVVFGTRDAILDYEVVRSMEGERALRVTYVGGPEGYKHTTDMSEKTVMEIITHSMANKYDRMTMTAGLCAMRATISYGLNKY